MVNGNEVPWLTIIGWGESGTQGLTAASREALTRAEVVFGARRHLRLLAPLSTDLNDDLTADLRTDLKTKLREWPVPFADGVPQLLAERGRRVVMLASGDPFWFGAGTSIVSHLEPQEWQALPSPSTFSLAASRLGWPIQDCTCLGLHAKPLTRVRPYLQPGRRLLVLVRDGDAVAALARWVSQFGFADSTLSVLEALGGEHERVSAFPVAATLPDDIAHPVAIALEVAGEGPALPLTPGLPDDFFEHDGQITKQAIRAMTLAALAPKPGERLWDIGTGSGSIAIEWLLAHPDNQAVGVEHNASRAARAAHNARQLGVDWLTIIEGSALDALAQAPPPDAVFIGGGLSQALLEALWEQLPAGTRLVANAVTLESEALLAHWHQQAGGELLRLELASAAPLGTRRGWKASYPIVQWRGVR